MGNLFSLFAGLAVLTACLGLFGLTSMSIEQRRREIGVRKVLGASTTSIVGLFSFELVKMVGYALLLAVPAVYVGTNWWLDGFAQRVAVSPWVLLAAASVALALAGATVMSQTWRAAVANPVESLRTE